MVSKKLAYRCGIILYLISGSKEIVILSNKDLQIANPKDKYNKIKQQRLMPIYSLWAFFLPSLLEI